MRRLEDEQALITENTKIILLPVPMTVRHRRKRGWNQAEQLALAVAEQSPDNFEVITEAVAKIFETPRQVSCRNKTERLNNVKNSFKVVAEKTNQLVGRIVIVVDDVTTTGATLNEVLSTIAKSQTKPRLLLGAAVAHG